MAKGNSLNRKWKIKYRILEHHKVRKDTVNENVGKCNRLSFPSGVFKLRLTIKGKNFNTVWSGSKCM